MAVAVQQGQLPRVGAADPGGEVLGRRRRAGQHEVRLPAGRSQGVGPSLTGQRAVAAAHEHDGVGLAQAEVAPGRVGSRPGVLGEEDHAVVVALGAVQALTVDEARCGHPPVLGQPRHQAPGDVRRGSPGVQADDGHHARLLRAHRRGRATGGPQPFGDLGEEDSGGSRLRAQQGLESRLGELQHGGVATGAHRGRARLAGQQRGSAEHGARSQLPHEPPGDLDLQPPTTHDVGGPGRLALAHQPGAGGQPHDAGRLLQAASRRRWQPGHEGHGREVSGGVPGRRPGRRPGHRPAGPGRRAQRGVHVGGTVGDRLLVVRRGPQASQRQRQDRHGHEGDDGQHPAGTEGGLCRRAVSGRRARRRAPRCRAPRPAAVRSRPPRTPSRSGRRARRPGRRCRAAAGSPRRRRR